MSMGTLTRWTSPGCVLVERTVGQAGLCRRGAVHLLVPLLGLPEDLGLPKDLLTGVHLQVENGASVRASVLVIWRNLYLDLASSQVGYSIKGV